MRIKEEVKRKQEGERRRKRLFDGSADVTARQRIITRQHQCGYIRLCHGAFHSSIQASASGKQHIHISAATEWETSCHCEEFHLKLL